jgi:molybdenum cofactor synthesis domain-containing protein
MNNLADLKIQVITISDRASQGTYEDESGQLLKTLLENEGASCQKVIIIPDKISKIQKVILKSVKKNDVVMTTGGTGISPRDVTNQATKELLDFEIPGISEMLRADGLTKIPTASLSRSLAGVVKKTLVINVPGSKGAVTDAVRLLTPILKHAVDQLNGGDHS